MATPNPKVRVEKPLTPKTPPTFHIAQVAQSALRSGKFRRNLDPQFASNSIQANPINGIGNLMIFMDGEGITDPYDLFFFVDGDDIRKMPEFINCHTPMTHVQRTQVVNIEGKESGLAVTAMVFCRIETGIYQEYVYYNQKNVCELFAHTYQMRGNKRDAYFECVSRFPEAMRCEYTYPDFHKGVAITPVNWNDRASQSLLAEPSQPQASIDLFSSKGLRYGVFQASQTFSYKPTASIKTKGHLATINEVDKSQDKENSHIVPSGNGATPKHLSGTKVQETQFSGHKKKKGVGSRRPLESPGVFSPKAKLSGKSTSPAGSKRGTAGSDESGKTGGSNSDSADSGEDYAQHMIKRKKKAKEDPKPGCSGQRNATLVASQESIVDYATDDEDFEKPPDKKKEEKSTRSKMKKTRCTTLCSCWDMREESLFEDFNDKMEPAVRDHRTIVHQHKMICSLRKKLNAIHADISSLDHRQQLQGARLAKIEQFSKTTARNVMFEDRKQKDYEELNLKFKTFTDLKDAVEQKKEVLERCMTYVDQVEFGRKFVDKFFKEVMDVTLLYRMYPADAPGKHKTLSGKLFTFGCEYHRLPAEFQDMVVAYAAERWPEMWPRPKTRKKICDVLEYHRKTRAIQMRNYLVAKIKTDPHPLLRALLWDNEEKVGVFDQPAPIWDNNKEDMDAYFAQFQPVWERKVAKLSGLARWERAIPKSFEAPDPKSKAERSVVAKRAEVEPCWAWN